MSSPVQPGNYKISNGAQAPGAMTLYLTFSGSNMPLTVELNATGNNQIAGWTVTGNSGIQAITPATTGFQTNASTAGEYVQAITNPCAWNISFDSVRQLYTIQTVGAALNWDLAGATSIGQSVALSNPSGNMPQYWKFVPAP